MSAANFVQIHTLTSYPASLLNRDDVGFAKRIRFGGKDRTRISSQCLKRHWRTFSGDHSLSTVPDTQMSVRSRLTFDRFVCKPLIDRGIPAELAGAATEALMVALLGESAKAKKKKAEDGASLETNQITVLGRPELDYFTSELATLCAPGTKPEAVKDLIAKHFTKERKKNIDAIRIGAGLDAALFGRMVTSDILARCDAALHVAHAFTVHEEATESDYFSAVDDLLQTGEDSELGSGHIGTTELSSGLYYGYVVVDVRKLTENLSDEGALAADIVERLVHLVSKVSPGAKLGSTAPHAFANLVMVEAGSQQPRTLANSFLSPVRAREDLIADTYAAMARHIADLDRMYGPEKRRTTGIGDTKVLSSVTEFAERLDDLAKWAGDQVRGE